MTSHYCAQKIPSRKAKYTQKEVLDRFMEVHGNKYDYSQFSFQTLEGKSTVICKIHGPFSISAKHHWQRKQGCGLCAGRLLSLAERINQFKVVHGNKYDYSRFCTTRAEDKGVVICRLHGEFLISGRDHKQGKGWIFLEGNHTLSLLKRNIKGYLLYMYCDVLMIRKYFIKLE